MQAFMSKRIRTHYDNLKVAPDAPIEVIRAAYRSLCKKYHPDQNRHNPDAHRIMSLVNRSYRVLSDPERRRAHDEWIAAQQSGHEPETIASPMPAHHQKTAESLPVAKLLLWLTLLAALIGALAWFAAHQRKSDPLAPAHPQTHQQSAPAKPPP